MRRIVPVLLCAFVMAMAESAWVGPAMPDKPINNPNIPKLTKPLAAEASRILNRKSDAQAAAGLFSTERGRGRPEHPPVADAPDDTLGYDGPNWQGVGLTSGGMFWSAVRFTPVVACTLKRVLFYQFDTTSIAGYVYLFDQGTTTHPGTLIESMPYSGPATLGWKLINLTSRTWAANRDFWLAVRWSHAAGQYPAGADAGHMVAAREYITVARDTWYANNLVGLDANWNLKVVLAYVRVADDMIAQSIDGLTSPQRPNQWLTIKATVKNIGTNNRPAGVPVILRITGPSVTYMDTVATTTVLAPNGTEQVTFTPNWRTPATQGFDTLRVYTKLSGDMNPTNDTTAYILEITNWLTYADWNSPYWQTWAKPLKGVMFDPTEFGVAYPVRIDSLKTSFCLAGKRWLDSTYRYKIYGGDLSTLLYTSPWLEASTGNGTYKYSLPAPVTITSGIYLVTVQCVNDSGPYVFGDNVHRYRSVYGDSTQWYYWSSGELFISNYVTWTASANDVGMTSIRAPWLYTEPNVPMSPIGVLRNYGTAAQPTIPCSVFVYDTTTDARVYAGYGTTSANPGDTARVTFSPQWTPPNRSDVYYTYMATFLTGDGNRGNDSAYHEFFGFHVNDPLVAPIRSVAVTVDGNIQTAEWADANKYDVSNILGWNDPLFRYFPNNCFAYFKHDSARLYVAVDIPFITDNDSTEIGLYFDENNDGAWAADSSEGNYWAEHFPPKDTIVFRALTPGAAWLTTATGSSSKTSFGSGHEQFEMSIPFGTGKAALNVNPDHDTLGFYTYVLDDKYFEWVGSWKTTMDAANWRNPSFYGKLVLTGRGGASDVGLTEIVAPKGIIDTGAAVFPSVKVRNNGSLPMTFDGWFVIDSGTVEKYRQSVAVTGLSVGKESTLMFPEWVKPHSPGDYATLCSLAVADTGTANNMMTGAFTVQTAPPWPYGWTEVASVPLPPSGKAVKDGGWLAYEASNTFIYAAKGNKTNDFYSYDAGADAWTPRAQMPRGPEDKPAGKGSTGCSDGDGHIYATKGNNTFGFYMYDVVKDSWYRKPDVPVGGGKKVKGGTSITWGYKGGVGYAYLLKGYKNEFYKYGPLDSSWTTLTPAPVGAKEKWDKGSWLVSDRAHLLYAHKVKYGEFYIYDTEMDSWSGLKSAIPILGSAGSKKVKDGSCAAYMGDHIYAFKGGNTVEFWRYSPEDDSWAEQTSIPLVGSTGKKKKIKAGAALAQYQAEAVFATKGNKCLEFWRFVPSPTPAAPASREGVMATELATGNCGLTIAPNPLASGFAVLRYGLPRAGVARLSVHNVAGQSVMEQTLIAGRSGSVNLDLRHLSNGVYLVKLSSEGFASTQKLVKQR